ncbi:efflux RND transporter permease subunit [Clostridium sp. 19966]|uniref:efflux RND transporter permease subunit n=1 Tax=Clostridium sp. 19966 TaxID=2768166 RepID=UPI0028E00B43|nr:efflux RND transporter permease subunit [Clostridium sp. 19966]MDT8716904.1 efflux RND transporter permease subunit [Clostridium sp. 19966]
MKKLMNFTMKNTLVVFLVVIMLIGGGIYSAKNIKMETMPDITIPVMTTTIIYPGASPEDVSDKITEPMQKAISGIQGVSSVKTINNENVGIIVTQFDYDTDMDKAEKNVAEAVGKVTLPDNAQNPVTSRIGFNSKPIMTYAIDGSTDKEKLTKFINDKVNPKLSGITGVSSISVQGTFDNSTYIKVNSDKLKENGLTLDNVKSALTGNNISMPVGQIDMNNQTLPIRTEKKINSIDEIKAIPIVIPINQQAIVGDSLNKLGEGMNQLGEGMNQLGSAVGQLGDGMGQMSQGMSQLAEGEGAIGSLVSSNTQAIAYLNAAQQIQMGILSQQAILSNPSSTKQQQAQAKATLTELQQKLTETQDALNKSLNDQIEKGKSLQQLQSSAQSSQSTSTPKSNTNSTTKSSSTKTSTDSSGASASTSSEQIQVKVIFLSDIAEITNSTTENQIKTRSNLKDGVILNVYKSDDANTVQVSNDIKDAIKELSKDDSSVKFSLVSDSAVSIKASVDGMVREGILGALFAIIVIAIFLRDIRATIIAVVSIPISIMIAMILLPKFGISLNTMSLGGIAVAVGRIVDDSIVVIENIYRRFSKAEQGDEELIKEASAEVGSAIMSSTITTVGVFLPLAFISGIVGKVFASFALTVVICILASLAVAIVVVPVLSKKMLLGKKIKHVEHEGKMVHAYRKILSAALNHRAIVLGLSIVILGGTVFLARKLPVQFLPSEATNTLTGKLTMSPGTAVDATNDYAMKFEKYLMARGDIETVATSVGDTSSSSKGALSLQGSNGASFTIVIKDGKNYDKVADEITIEADKLSDKNGKFQVSAQSFSGQTDNVEVDLYGDNSEDLSKAAGIVAGKLNTLSELTNVTNSASEKKPEIEVKVDANKAADNGLTSVAVAATVRSDLNSSIVTTINNNGADSDVYLGYADKKFDNIDSVKNLEITGMKGTIKLSDVAEVSQGYGPVSVSELDGKQYVSVTANINSKDTSKANSNAKKAVEEIENQFPKGVTYTSGGSNQQIKDAFSQMGMAMLIAIGLVYMVMVVTFGEGRTPFAILFSLPFAAIGALLALLITGQSLSVSGLIGMLMLIGIVVTNAIVLLDRVNHNREKMTIKEALMEAGGVRLRPILMTAIATVTALIPLALGFSEGALISQSLGIVVIGGLVVSTMLTLIVVPVIYSIIQKEKL